jgi:hypothetical protein
LLWRFRNGPFGRLWGNRWGGFFRFCLNSLWFFNRLQDRQTDNRIPAANSQESTTAFIQYLNRHLISGQIELSQTNFNSLIDIFSPHFKLSFFR